MIILMEQDNSLKENKWVEKQTGVDANVYKGCLLGKTGAVGSWKWVEMKDLDSLKM